ncbi:hypothetical protein L1856_06950 [Streptomyces sp. Tue 6430]|nr:hypothetical protein [Streptomyces sp. Tue 6430]
MLWVAVGAVVASAAWAAGVFLTGGEDAGADLRGYTAPVNLCSSTDHSSFEGEYPEDDGSPTHNSLKDEALDESYCSINLKKTGSSYADAYLSTQVDLHKESDPGPEFTAMWKNYQERYPVTTWRPSRTSGRRPTWSARTPPAARPAVRSTPRSPSGTAGRRTR